MWECSGPPIPTQGPLVSSLGPHYVPADLPVPTPAAVPALIPLSLLEAIRNLDTPVEDGLDELAEEIVVRRLGLSPTVAAQIQRYRQTAEQGRRGGRRRGRSRCCGWWAAGPTRRWCSPTRAGGRRATPPGCTPRPAWTLSRVSARGADPADRAALGDPPGAAGLRRRPACRPGRRPGPDGRAALVQGAAGRLGLRLLRGGVRRAAAAAHRVRGGHAPRALPGAGRRGVSSGRTPRRRSTK